MKIGKAKYGMTQKKYFKLKDGDSKFRILPPLGDLADKGVWSVFYKVHYGYKNSKGKLRVFQSSLVENRQSKMVEVPDAAVQRIKELKAKLDEAKATGNKAVVERIGKLVSGQKPMYNLDSNHYMNVIDDQGNIGVLKLRHRAKKALDTQISKMREKGVDPLSVDNGRYFVFTRTGTGLDTSFSVEVLKRDIEVQGVGIVQQEVQHKLDDSLISRLEQEAAKLDQLFRALTADEIERIVKASDLFTGQSPAIDEIFDAKGSSDDDGDMDEDDEESLSSGSTSSSTQASAAPIAAPVATAPTPAPVAAAKPAMVETKAEAKAATQAAALNTTAETVNSMSDADFLKSLGLS